MSQSEVIAVTLVGGFVLYLAMAGKLGAYWSLLTGGGAASAAATTPSTGSGATTGSTPTPANPSGNWLLPPMPSFGFPGVIDPFPRAPGFGG